MNPTELEAAILKHVGRSGYQPVKPRVIAKKLGLRKNQAADVKKAVKRLVARGKLAYGASHLVIPVEMKDTKSTKTTKSTKDPKSAKTSVDNRIVGVFRRNDAGYGFVRPSGTAPAAARSKDVYISAQKSGNAATGDVVAIRISKSGRKKDLGPKGEIVEILQRHTRQFVGTYFETTGVGMVEVDGTIFSRPISVGDPGAKGVKPDDKVVFDMVRFPSHYRDGEGVITEVLGQRGTPGVDTLSIIREFELPDEFPEDVLEDARKQAERFSNANRVPGAIPADRTDLTALTVLTIDPVDARDFDDAISLEQLENGHWRLGVHIADVSHFVPVSTALDREAQQRATSVYLPDRVLPMLPEVISNSLASLQPHKIRYTKSAFIEFTPEGVRTSTELCSAAIKSDHRFAYEEVDDYLADREAWRKKLDGKVHALLGRMHELAMILRERRMRRGALELNMPEVKIDLDDDGRVSGAHLVVNTESHQIIEEFMLAANEAVAERIFSKELPFLRRVHEAPSARKLKALSEFVNELGFKTESKSLESRFEIQKLLDRVAGKPEQRAVNYAVLRSFQRAVYSPIEEGHYALASDCYCHFTSPIRRYPDLTIHRLVDQLIRGKKPVTDMNQLMVLGEHCSDREHRAEAAERELISLKLLLYLSDRIGEEMDAVVTGVERFGLFVEGIELPAEGLIHISTLDDDQYQFDRTTHTLTGRRKGNLFRLGDLVRVAVGRIDIERRELDFRLIHHTGHPQSSGKPTTKKQTKKTKQTPRKGSASRKRRK